MSYYYENNLFTAIVSLVSFSLLVFFFFSIEKKKRQDTHRTTTNLVLPPGPRKLPILGNLHQLMGKAPPHRSLQKLSKTHGDLMFLQLGFAPTLVVSSADRAREIFKSHDAAFSGRPALYAVKRLSYDCSAISLAPYGEYWREIRKVTALELVTPKRIQSFGSIRVKEVASMMDRIGSTNNRAVDLSSLAFLLTENVIRRVLFGKSVDEGRKRGEFHDKIRRLQHLAVEFNVADYFPGVGWINRVIGVDARLDEAARDLDRFVDKIIEEHLHPTGLHQSSDDQDDAEDLIDVLIGVHKDPSRTITITKTQVKGILLDIFGAATDSSSTTIIWTMTELMRNPSAKQKAEQEVREVAKGKSQVDEADLPKLVYLKHVIKESLRLHSPVPLIPRETTENCTIDNRYMIPAKTRVLFNVAAISTDLKYWENPEEFKPERFINSHVDFKGLHYELLPFGAGRRGCPGMNFATPLLELALANLLFRFDWKLPEGLLAEDLDMEEAPGLTVNKKTPLWLLASQIMD